MGKLSTIASMSRHDQMNYYRARRKDAYAQMQAQSSQANGLVSIKVSEAQGMGNIVAKVAHQRSVNKKA
ncbi:hypothetical protein ASD83_00615 [Devosia sp. Root685]|uniref:hypothetical protein n=1 Tax=Devosia sp. Root685 TaxID=1736587 RepID=UPI0006F63402|nr:hypothetical protein [Devosia sp. Root685]KRA99078.1 hypothetical protein ASD83_00615 [Devosia sp. Root685]